MEKIWLKSYPEGIPAEIDLSNKMSLVDRFNRVCEKFSSRPAFYNLGQYLTYQQLALESKAFAAFLQQHLKLEKGSRVAVMLPNVLQYPIILWGILQAGCIVVNV